MSENIFDRYKAGRSVIHQLDPRTKLVVTVLFTLSNVLLPDGMWVGFLLVWGVLLFWCHLAKLGWGFTFVRSFVVLPFAVAAITVVFTLPVHPTRISPVHVAGWGLGICSERCWFDTIYEHPGSQLALDSGGNFTHRYYTVPRPGLRITSLVCPRNPGLHNLLYGALPVCFER
jgi:energy-coupling factor transporter transmembrane protein EcfT